MFSIPIVYLPPGAIHLASSRLYANQAFAWRRRGLALQFHAEVEAQTLERWFIGHAAEIGAAEGVLVNDLRRQTAAHAASLERRSRNFWRAWLREIAAGQNQP